MTPHDLTIIGAGASGLACAVSAAENGVKDICLLERLPRAGKKLLATGNGRCNLSRENITADSFHGSFDVSPILAEFPDIRPFFKQLGMFTYTDPAGRIYPLSNTASSVLDALRLAAENAGATLLTETKCTSLSRKNGVFEITTDKGTLYSKAVVLAGGGCASPVQGSDGSCLSLARSAGIEITPLHPALCPIPAENTKPLDGLRVKCAASLNIGKKTLKTVQGEVQFTKTALSGICIFDLSAVYPKEKANVTLDLFPEKTLSETEEMLTMAVSSRKTLSSADALTGVFNRRLGVYLLKRINQNPDRPAKTLSPTELQTLAKASKALAFETSAPADFNSAQVTAGGVKGTELSSSLMSIKVDGLFLSGEIIDAHGDCGGNNLHFAFATGIKAGISAADFIKGN